jgi:arylsulfatase A-like enzyme
MGNKPDVIIFMMDQLAAKWLECAETSGAFSTPSIDHLRAMGTTFTKAYTPNPVCMPARATLATGLGSHGHRVIENGYELDPKIPTFMQILQKSGWHTGAFGKLHFRTYLNGPIHDYRPYGFDEVRAADDMKVGEWLDWIETEHPEYYEAALSTASFPNIPGMREYGNDKIDLREKIIKAKSNFHKNHVICNGQPVNDLYTLPFPNELTQTEWITSRAERFIRETDPGIPILCNISYVQPHDPFTPPEDCLEMVNAALIPDPLPESWKKDPGHPKHFDYPEMCRGIPAYWREGRRHYFATLVHLDRQLGRVFDVLKESRRLNNAYIILVSDHGEMLYDHGITSKHNKHYDGCIRIPLIIAGPGLQKGETCDELVQLEDIFPTIIEMTGTETPPPRIREGYRVNEEYMPKLAGYSLIPFCHGGGQPVRDFAYVESYRYWSNVRTYHWPRTVITKNYRYTYYPAGGGEQLFDLTKDPGEQINLAADSSYGGVRQQLRDMLLDRLITKDDPKCPIGCAYEHEHP